MSAYVGDPRVVANAGGYVVDGKWMVVQRGPVWFAYDATVPNLSRKDRPGRPSADELIGELIGEAQ